MFVVALWFRNSTRTLSSRSIYFIIKNEIYLSFINYMVVVIVIIIYEKREETKSNAALLSVEPLLGIEGASRTMNSTVATLETVESSVA